MSLITTPLTSQESAAIAFLSTVGLANISDALDTRGVNGGCEGLRPLRPGLRAIGPAFTVEFEPVAPGESAPAADYLDDVPAGNIVVSANGGRSSCTVWGDLLTHLALRRGVAGTVIDGVCRDAREILALDYPLFSRGAYMKSGKNRVRMRGAQIPVTIAGTLVHPGDIVCADDSGVLVLARPLLLEIAALVRRIAEMEQAVLQDIGRGVPMREARKRHRYNDFALKPDRP